jgi:capsular exopolysaccharide synthesis family protein
MSTLITDSRNVPGISYGRGPDSSDSAVAIRHTQNAPAPGQRSFSGESEVISMPAPASQMDRLTTQEVVARLPKCATIRLPKSEEKSLLLAQYDPAMRSAVEAYRALRIRLDKQQSKKGRRSLGISSAAQGEGRSLTAFNLALCYSKMENFPLLLVDADLRSQGLSKLLGVPETPGLSKILEQGLDYQLAIQATDIGGLYVLPAGSCSNSPSELFIGPRWKQFLAWAMDLFNLVIVDCPPISSVANFELVMAPCESTIVVVRSRRTATGQLARALAQIDSKKIAGVVFNASEETVSG